MEGKKTPQTYYSKKSSILNNFLEVKLFLEVFHFVAAYYLPKERAKV